MIANRDELTVAVRNLQILEQALEALRAQLQAENPDLLQITSPAYVQRIQTLQEDIAHYLYGHPADVSTLLHIDKSSAPRALAA